MRLDRTILRQPLMLLFTLPASIALGVGALAPIVHFASNTIFGDDAFGFLPVVHPATVHTLLSVIATAAMTALSLTYSLVLVVFTLAAGNIGPRLIKRFTSDLVNQITAGIFGGTFVYSVGALLLLGDNRNPTLTAYVATLLAIVSMLQLVYFVRNVSTSISIDDEVAGIAARAATLLQELREEGGTDTEVPEIDFDHQIEARQSGYLGKIDVSHLVDLASDHDVVVRIEEPQGSYLLAGQTVACFSRSLDDDAEDAFRHAIAIEPARSENGAVEFPITLLVEIALRALSPGVNDTFTALAVVDSLSNVFSDIAGDDPRARTLCDDDGNVCIIMPALALKRLLGTAFHPLRRATIDNVLMAQGLARAYTRLYLIGGDTMREILENHVRLLIEDMARTDHLDDDVESVLEQLTGDLRKKASADAESDAKAPDGDA